MGTRWAANGSALWELFFEPYCRNISAWLEACAPNVRLTPLVNEKFWYPLVQQQWRWPVRPWYNKNSVEEITCKAQGWCGTFNETVYHRWRQAGTAVVHRVHRLKPSFRAAVDERMRTLNPRGLSPVLAMHMRGTDKGGGRPRSFIQQYHAFAFDFLETFRGGLIIIATDSSSYAREVDGWTRSSFSKIRCGEHRCPFEVVMPPIRTRAPGFRGNFHIGHDKVEVARDALLDIQTMARADYLVHGSSAMAEAAIYTNPALHCASVDLDYAHFRDFRTSAPWRPRARPGCRNLTLPNENAPISQTVIGDDAV